jgi:hypothetical protein
MKGATTVVEHSVVTCPNCHAAKIEMMPTDTCQFFYECAACGELLRPKRRDCCVFCSYGSVPCPSIQQRAIQQTGAWRAFREHLCP